MLKAPYNFVELNHDVFIPDWGERISHDVPFSDGEDGRIEVELVNHTPLFVRNGVGASAQEKEVWPSHIVKPDGTKAYFLPGSSIKGMLRAVLEILSFGRLDAETYNDEYFGYREFGGKNSSNHIAYLNFMAKVGYGWLHYDKAADCYLLDDCGDFDKDNCTIAISELEKILPEYKEVRGCDAFEKAEALHYPKVKGKTLVCSGHMGGKRHEYLFGDVRIREVKVPESVVDQMKSIYKPSKCYYGPLCSKLRNGERIPVFFKRDADGNGVIEIGLTRMFRHANKYRMSDTIRQENKVGHDLAQCIFGYTEKLSSLKGRVSIGNAFCSNEVPDGRLIGIRGVLGQPSASYYPLYVKQLNQGKYTTYDDSGVEMAGRKRYRIHADQVLTELPTGNDNEKVMTEMKMLPAGLHFRFSMSLHNMRPEEVGALLSALTFHGTKGVYHNIGMAKSYGYGKLEIQKVTLHGFKRDVNDYMHDFELCMSKFTKESGVHALWKNTPQVSSLLSIASEHCDRNELAMMTLDEYGTNKKNNAYSNLKENAVHPNSLVTDADMAKYQHKDDVERLEKQVAGLKAWDDCTSSECLGAVNLLTGVMKEYDILQGGPQGNVFQDRIDELQKMKAAYNDAVLKKSSSNISKAAAESFEKQVPKVSSIGQLKGALQKWMKGKDRDALTEGECRWLHDRLAEYWKDKAFKKEKKKWQNAGQGAWKDLAAFIYSEKLLAKWYEELNVLTTNK